MTNQTRTKRVVLVITITKWGEHVDDHVFYLTDDQWQNRRSEWKLRGMDYRWINEDLIVVIKRKEDEGSK